MAQAYQHLRSETAGAIPTAASMAVGQLAFNVADKKYYTKTAAGVVVDITPDSVTSATAVNVAALPTAGVKGRIVFLTTDNHFYGDNGTSWDDFSSKQVADTTIPTVTITAPSEGASLVGATNAFTATATDNVAIRGIKFYLDNALIETEDTTSPYSVNIDATTLAAGTHTLKAVAFDTAGNPSAEATRSITVSAPVAALLLDSLPSKVAFDLKRLRTGYAGSCLRVRNTATNVETDIGFDANGNINWAAAAAAGASLVVVKWYDQSGAASDFAQATATKQPVLDQAAKEVVFNGTTHSMATAAAVAMGATNKISWAFRLRSPGGGYLVLVETGAQINASGYVCHVRQTSYDNYVGTSGGSNNAKSIVKPDALYHTEIFTADKAAATDNDVVQMYLDGAQPTQTQVANSAVTGAFTDQVINLGARNNASLFFVGGIRSLILTGAILTTSERSSLNAGAGVQN